MSTQHDPVARNVHLANDIAKNLAVGGGDMAVDAIANHIRRFWDPRMRATIFAHVENGGEGLHPLALKAIQKLAREAKKEVG